MWIMESILIFLVVSLMSSPAFGASESFSCSTVNGQTICERKSSSGNSAASFGQAAVGGGKSFQDVYAGAGNPGQWDSGRQTVFGANGANGQGGSSSGSFSSSSSSSSDFFPGQTGGFGFAPGGGIPFVGGYPAQGASGGFAPGGGSPVGGGSFAFSGGYPAQGAAGGFASGGGFPVGGGGNGGGNPAQGAAGGFAPGGGSPVGGGSFAFSGGYPAQGAAGGFATAGTFPYGFGFSPVQAPPGGPANEGPPQAFDPFMFVRPFMNGGGAGGFPGMPFFGRP